MQQRGAVVLCGGESSRMGADKSRLPFGDKTFLEAIVDSLLEVVQHVVVVRSATATAIPGEYPPSRVRWLNDEVPGKGPLEGIRVGLAALHPHVVGAFVTGCDVPMLKPDVVRMLFSRLGEHEAVIPCDPPRVYGMTAVYRTGLHGRIGQMIQEGRLRVAALADEFDSLRISIDEIRSADPDLDSMTNVNSRSGYIRLLKSQQMPVPPEFLPDDDNSDGG